MGVKHIKRGIMLGLCTLALAACHGGSGNDNATGTPISAKSGDSQFQSSQCLSGLISIDSPASLYYTGAKIDVTNNCSNAIDLSKYTMVFSAQDKNGSSVDVDYGKFTSWWFNNAEYYVNFKVGNGTQQVGTFSTSGASLTLPAKTSVSYNGGFKFAGKAIFDKELANNSLQFMTSSENIPVQTADMDIVVDTTNAGCSAAEACNGLNIKVLDNTGTQVAGFNVPQSSYGAVYNQQITKLVDNANYTIVGSVVTNADISYVPTENIKVSSSTTNKVTIKYTKKATPVATGSATISLANVVPNYKDSLQLEILNSKDNNKIVSTYGIKLGEPLVTGDLPVSDSTHEYKIKLVTGVADPANNLYYLESGVLPTLVINSGSSNTLSVTLYKSVIATKSITVAISGLESHDSAAIKFSDAATKYRYVNSSGKTNGNSVYHVENGLNFGVSVAASGSSYETNPLNYTLVITADATINAAFKLVALPELGNAKVIGWPTYIAMGAVGGPNTDPTNIYSGDDGFGGKPVDAVFKYAGVNGNGDPGVIDPPMNALRMTMDLTNVSKANNLASRVVIVEYTGEMSGGENISDFTNTSVPYADKQNATYIMARHFISLAADAQALADRPIIKDGHKYYGSLIMNPDLLGAIQQNNYIDKVNDQLPESAVNKAVDQALCLLTKEHDYTNTSAPNGSGGHVYENKTYHGTPYQILAKLVDDGYPVWSLNAPSDAYWGTGINNRNGEEGPYSEVGKWFNDCVSNPTHSTTRPSFPAGFDGWVQANNWLIKTFAKDKDGKSAPVTFGWQDNMWAVNSGFWLHNELSDSEIASGYSTPVINWLNAHAPSTIKNVGGALSPDYFVFDRYETDDSSAPGAATLYSARSWDNFLVAVGQISKAFNNIPVMLWQIPGSHLPYTGETSPELFNGQSGSYIFSTAPVYFFGDSKLTPDLSNLIMGSSTGTTNAAVGAFPMQANYNCTGCNYKQYLLRYKGKDNNFDWSRDNGKLTFAANNNIFAILWGGGNTTNVIKNFSNPSDHGWLANKIIQYYQQLGLSVNTGNSDNGGSVSGSGDSGSGTTPKCPVTPLIYPAGINNYQAGSVVQGSASNTKLYACKPWPYTGWCNDPAYAPTGIHGTSAWDEYKCN